VLGYVQYFNRIPALLVGFHVFGAVCVFVCVQQLLLELRVADDTVPSVVAATRAGPTVDASTAAVVR
jgi:hypothetical protein